MKILTTAGELDFVKWPGNTWQIRNEWHRWHELEALAVSLNSQGKFSDPIKTGFAQMAADEQLRQACLASDRRQKMANACGNFWNGSRWIAKAGKGMMT